MTSTQGHPLIGSRWLTGSSLIVGAFLLFGPTISQPESYHAFADARRLSGIPNFWNVISNVPFAVIGVMGLRKHHDVVNRILYAGLLLTAFGSAYYHLAPDDARLVWDRLPMTLVFMSLLAGLIAQGRDRRWELWILSFLLGCGIVSVLWWNVTGDLRPYAVVQFGPAPVMLPAFWRSARRRYLWGAFGSYTLAKFAEYSDAAIYSVMPLSGHTVKHVLAALAAYCIWKFANARPSFRVGL
jgi:ceramidase